MIYTFEKLVLPLLNSAACEGPAGLPPHSSLFLVIWQPRSCSQASFRFSVLSADMEINRAQIYLGRLCRVRAISSDGSICTAVEYHMTTEVVKQLNKILEYHICAVYFQTCLMTVSALTPLLVLCAYHYVSMDKG